MNDQVVPHPKIKAVHACKDSNYKDGNIIHVIGGENQHWVYSVNCVVKTSQHFRLENKELERLQRQRKTDKHFRNADVKLEKVAQHESTLSEYMNDNQGVDAGGYGVRRVSVLLG